jgi:hypothetical protein
MPALATSQEKAALNNDGSQDYDVAVSDASDPADNATSD